MTTTAISPQLEAQDERGALDELLDEVLAALGADLAGAGLCVLVGTPSADDGVDEILVQRVTDARTVSLVPRSVEGLEPADVLHGATVLDPVCDIARLRTGHEYKQDAGDRHRYYAI